MCFVLYMASHSEAPRIPWNEQKPALWTGDLTEHESEVRSKFTLPFVTYIGSDDQCGCGFRSAMFQGGEWPEEGLVTEPDYDPSDTQPNHAALVSFLQQHFSAEPFVELYGCWDGEFSAATEGRIDIAVDRIADTHFHFRER